MTEKKKVDKGLVAKLQSDRPSIILEGIEDTRTAGTVTIIPYLFDIIATNKNESIINEVIKTIGDIKNKEAVPYIVDSIQKHDYGQHYSEVVATCWQSSLDFSDFIPVFASIFIKADYQTSVEAFTVIEESVYNAAVERRNECLKILDNNFNQVAEEKRPLFSELRNLIKHSLDFTIDNQRNIS